MLTPSGRPNPQFVPNPLAYGGDYLEVGNTGMMHQIIAFLDNATVQIAPPLPTSSFANNTLLKPFTDPAPIPDEELQRTYEWVKSWGMLEQTDSALNLVDAEVQKRAHAAAE